MSTLDFTKSEIDLARKPINNRWRDQNKEIHLADIDYKPKDGKRTPYPALVWEDKETTFVVLKIAAFSYKSFFYYQTDQRFDTGVESYSDLNECVDNLLKAQADYLLSANADINKSENTPDNKGSEQAD